MKILITGIHGFVGTNLTAYLHEQGHTLYGVDIVAPPKTGLERTFSWEELKSGAVPPVDAIIHLAGKAHDTKKKAQAKVYFDINTGLTKVIYDYFLASQAKKFLFFSSVKAAADRVEGETLTEEVVPAPVGPYGESKIRAEEYIQSKMPDDKAAYILRPCMIHGPGNKGNLNLLYAVVKRGIPWPLGSFENRRTFTSIGNLCYLINGLLEKPVASGIYHIADDEALSTNELIAVMCRAMGRTPHIWRLNRKLMEAVAKAGTLLHLPLNQERLGKLTENYVASNRKIKAALGIEHLPVRAEEGLTRTIKSFIHHADN